MNSPTSAAGDAEVRDRNSPQRHGTGAVPQGMEAQATQPSAAPITLLKHGRPLEYGRCDCCDQLAQKLSKRFWCAACEFEFTVVGRKVRAKLEAMRCD